jgi:MGT family glycosyltransferase
VARVLIVVPPLVGHINPLVAVAAELAARGHAVAWAGSPEVVAAAVGGPVTVYPAGVDPDRSRPANLRSFAALRHLWEQVLVPLAASMLDGVDTAVRRFRPDLLLCDQQALAGPLVAQRHGLDWVSSASTSAELTDPLAAMPKVADWIRETQAGLYRTAGLPVGDDLRFSPRLTLAFTAAELAGDVAVAGVRFVGPSLRRPSGLGSFPVDRLDPDRPLVLVTLGTVNAEAADRFLDAAFDGCAAEAARFQTVIADPGGRLRARAAGSSTGPIVVDHIPVLELLPRTAAVVCHGGHNTVVEALRFGVPLAVAPIRDDQPIIAGQVVGAGAGVRLRFERATAADIAAACRTLLDTDGPRAGARRVGAALAAAGGAPAAVDALQELLASSPVVSSTSG